MSLETEYKNLEKAMSHNKETEVEEIFTDILKKAIDIVNSKFKNNEKLNLENKEDFAVTRVMFEYMLELWDENSITESKQVGYDMLYLSNDKKLQEMFSMFVIGMIDGLDVDQFFNKYVNKSNVYKKVFFTDFNDAIDALVIKHKKKFQEEYEKDAC